MERFEESALLGAEKTAKKILFSMLDRNKRPCEMDEEVVKKLAKALNNIIKYTDFLKLNNSQQDNIIDIIKKRLLKLAGKLDTSFVITKKTKCGRWYKGCETRSESGKGIQYDEFQFWSYPGGIFHEPDMDSKFKVHFPENFKSIKFLEKAVFDALYKPLSLLDYRRKGILFGLGNEDSTSTISKFICFPREVIQLIQQEYIKLHQYKSFYQSSVITKQFAQEDLKMIPLKAKVL